MAPQKTSVVTVDVGTGKVNGQFINYMTMDVNTATLSFQVMQQDIKYALANVTAKVFLNMEDSSQFVDDCEIVDADNGVIQYTLQSNEIKHAGRVDAEFYLIFADSSVGTFTFTFYIKKSLIDSVSVPNQEVVISDFETFKANLEATLATVQQQLTDAQAQANNIETLVNQNQVAKQVDLNATNEQLAEKVDKNGNEQISMVMLAPDVKAALTGGAVASLTSDGVNTSYLAENAVTPEKTSLFNYKFPNQCYLTPALITYDVPVQASAIYSNGSVNFSFTGINGAWLKLSNLIVGKQYLYILNNNGFSNFKRYGKDKVTVLQSLSDFHTNSARQKWYQWFTATEDTMYIWLNNNGASLTPIISYFKLYQIDNQPDIIGFYDIPTNTMNEVPTIIPDYIDKPEVGKTGNAIGDSITVGATNNNVSYVTYVSENLGLTYNNYGVSGEEVGSAYARIDAMPNNVDFITFFEGTNDFNAGEPLGNDTDPADVTFGTFYSRYRAVIEKCLTKWNTASLILITPLQRAYQPIDGNVNTMTNANGWTLKQYVDAIKNLAVEYGLPVIDLYSISGISPFNILTYTNDGLHPNDLGHRKIASIIANKIKEYISVS